MMVKVNKGLLFAMAFSMMAIFGMQSCGDKPITPPPPAPIKTGVQLNFAALWEGQPITFLSGYFKNTATQPEYIQFLNFGMIISKLSLVKEDGSEVLLGDGYQWIDFKKSRTQFDYEVPEGSYKAVKFTFGLDSAINHGDPNQWGPEHPLNGNLTGMHWGWAGGYIFQAIDGNYKDSLTDKFNKGMSFHAATDAMKREFTIPVGAIGGPTGVFGVSAGKQTKVTLNYHVNKLFQAIELKKGAVSHSEGAKESALMERLLSNLSDFKAFEVPIP